MYNKRRPGIIALFKVNFSMQRRNCSKRDRWEREGNPVPLHLPQGFSLPFPFERLAGRLERPSLQERLRTKARQGPLHQDIYLPCHISEVRSPTEIENNIRLSCKHFRTLKHNFKRFRCEDLNWISDLCLGKTFVKCGPDWHCTDDLSPHSR